MNVNAARSFVLVAFIAFVSPMGAAPAHGQDKGPVDRLKDRGEGLPLSMFGTYIRSRELVVYPFFEYYRDNDYEYEAGELGYVGTTELSGGIARRKRSSSWPMDSPIVLRWNSKWHESRPRSTSRASIRR